MIDLSILVCAVYSRHDTFLLKIEKQLFDQYNRLSEPDRSRVELIVLTDNKQQMLGRKRNLMVRMAQGRYIVFIDDDDRIADDYVSTVLEATDHNADCIVFQAEVTINGGGPRVCYFSKDFSVDYDTAGGYYRIPNHICCVKRVLSLRSSFPSIPYAEDTGYGKALWPHLKTEHKIDRVLYYYDFNERTTETQVRI